MTPFAIAGLQLNLSARQDNLHHIQERVGHLMSLFPWVQMIVLSELAAFGPSPAKAQPLPGPAEEMFGLLAARHRVWLLTGSLFERSGGKVYNTATILDPSGGVVARYRKMFPFLPYEEGVEPGTEFLVFDVPDAGRFGVSICYDLWFPETSRMLAALGAEVILHPSMTTTTDRDVELAIARATAAIDQCFVVDVNGVGDGGVGKSIIVGPAGDVIHQAGDGPELMPLEIDLDRVRRTREFGLRGLGQPLKSFRDRRVEFPVYQPEARDRFFRGLGPLSKPARGSRAGLDGPPRRAGHGAMKETTA